MKFSIFFIFFTSFFLSYSQTTISFSNPNQVVEYSSETTNVTIKISINSINSHGSNNINLQLFSSLEKSGAFYEPTKINGKDIILVPATLNEEYEIVLPLSNKRIIDKQVITLTLKKKGIDSSLVILEKHHSLIFNKKKEKPKSKISIVSAKKDLEFDFAKDGSLEIPFKIKSTGYSPVKKDSVTVEIKLKELEDYNDKIKPFSIVGMENAVKIVFNEEEDKKLFKQFTEKLIEKDKISIEIKKINEKSEKEISVDNTKKTITYSLKKKNSNANRYNFYLGTNFDLQDQFKATSFYSEIDAWLPELIDDKWGIRAGLYKNNNSRSLEESASDEFITEITNQTADSISFQTKRVRSVPNAKIENFGLYIEALFKLIDEKNFTGHLAVHFETIERNEKYTFESDDIISFKPTTISLDSLENSNTLRRTLGRPRNFTRKYFDSYYGFGFPMNYRNTKSNFTVFLNPIFGIGDSGLFLKNPDADKAKLFGIFQFSLIEEKFGVKLSGEIRKYFGFFQDPIISINISKKINLTNVLDPKEKD